MPRADDAASADFEMAYLNAAIRAGKGGTAIFEMRLMGENRPELLAILSRIHPDIESGKALFERAFGKLVYIHLSRADKLAQAISLIKAEQTSLWHVASDGSEIERMAPPQEPSYDFATIERELVELERHDAEWTEWFTGERISPLRIGYEELSRDPAATLAVICAALGVAAPEAIDVKPRVAKLADATSVEWMRRYRSDRNPKD